MNAHKISPLFLVAAACFSGIGVQARQQDVPEKGAATTQTKGDALEQTGEIQNGFTLDTRYDKVFFKDGEPIIVTLRLKNLRPTTEIFIRHSDVQNFGVKVTTGDGKPVPLTKYGSMMYKMPVVGSSIQVRMKPGDEVTGKLSINRIYDMSVDGKYNITISTQVDTDQDRTLITSKTTSVTVAYEG